jgi:hypothetical protein
VPVAHTGLVAAEPAPVFPEIAGWLVRDGDTLHGPFKSEREAAGVWRGVGPHRVGTSVETYSVGSPEDCFFEQRAAEAKEQQEKNDRELKTAKELYERRAEEERKQAEARRKEAAEEQRRADLERWHFDSYQTLLRDELPKYHPLGRGAELAGVNDKAEAHLANAAAAVRAALPDMPEAKEVARLASLKSAADERLAKLTERLNAVGNKLAGAMAGGDIKTIEVAREAQDKAEVEVRRARGVAEDVAGLLAAAKSKVCAALIANARAERKKTGEDARDRYRAMFAEIAASVCDRQPELALLRRVWEACRDDSDILARLAPDLRALS